MSDERWLRVFLVDDHPGMLAGWRSQLGDAFEIIGQADDADPAIELIREAKPDVVVLDVHLPGGGGQRVAREVKATDPDIAFLAISMSDATEDVLAVVAAGAGGYLTKTAESWEVIDAVRRVHRGEAVFSPELAGLALEVLGHDAADVGDEELASLTARELEVLRLIARGYTYREVGDALFVSVKTIETHMSHILRKLRLANRHQLARWAARRRLD